MKKTSTNQKQPIRTMSWALEKMITCFLSIGANIPYNAKGFQHNHNYPTFRRRICLNVALKDFIRYILDSWRQLWIYLREWVWNTLSRSLAYSEQCFSDPQCGSCNTHFWILEPSEDPRIKLPRNIGFILGKCSSSIEGPTSHRRTFRAVF